MSPKMKRMCKDHDCAIKTGRQVGGRDTHAVTLNGVMVRLGWSGGWLAYGPKRSIMEVIDWSSAEVD